MTHAKHDRPRSLTRLLVAVSAAVVLAVGGIVPAAVAAGLPGLDGDGTTRAPYQIGSADELRAVADAINSDPGSYAGATYRLTADIDFAGTEFVGINTFTGVFEGAGHVISNIVYGHSTGTNSGRLGFFRQITDATVRNLVLDGVTANNPTSSDWVAGISVLAARSTITGNSVIDAVLSAPNAEKVAGITAEMDGGVTSDNWVDATITANKMAGGISAYSKNGVTIADNLVDADLTVVVGGGANGTRGVDAGLVINYPGNPSGGSAFTGNVAYAGSITYSGKVDGFAGRILGYAGYDGWTANDNLANSAITIGGAPVVGPGTKNQQGTDVTTEQLAQRATYEGLGWDFANAWRFDETLQHPVPNFVYSLFGEGTAQSPYEIGSEDDLEFLAAQLNNGNALYTGAKSFVVTSDLDFAGRSAWPGINTFTGVLDGTGHRISNLVYGPGDAGKSLGFFRQITDATVRNLVLDGVTADNGTATQFVSGLTVYATRSTITGNTLLDAELVGRSAEKVSGLVAELDGGRVTDNWVDVTATAAKMPGGAVAYTKNGGVIANNLVEAELTVLASGGSNGTRGIDAGFAISYPGNPSNGASFSGNVAYAGSIAYTGKVDGFTGRVVGYTGYEGWTASKNLANPAITIGGAPVAAPGTKNQHGADTSSEALAQRATYEAIGWDFATAWRFDEELGHPIPKYVLPGEVPNRVTATFYGDPSTQRAFTWYSTIESDSGAVVLSTDREFPEGSSTVQVAATRETNEHGETFYRAIATELTPGTRYYYRLGDAVEAVWSAAGSFTTNAGSGDFTFVDLTDTQAQNLGEAQLSAATMAKSLKYVPDAQFVMHNGDIVEHGDVEQDWTDMLDSARPSLMNTTIVPAVGNHDQSKNALTDHFTLEAPNGQDTSSGAYYSFTYNSAHFMVLNSNEDGAQAISPSQLEWLRADATAARAAGAKWLILSLHKGPYSTANHISDPDVKAMRAVLMPVIDELDIDLVLQGHDHVMSRSKVLVSDPAGVEGARAVEATKYTEIINGKRVEYTVDPQGTIFFLPNTAGAKHYTQATSANGFDLESYLQLFDRTGEQATENFAAISVADEKLTVDVYDIRNQGIPRVFESFGIDRSLSPADAQIAALPALEAVTVADAAAVNAARATVDGLNSAQREALANLRALEALEHRLRELAGLVSADGSVVAWAKPDADERQAITVRNDTRSDFAGTPVQLRIADTPDGSADALGFFSPDGVPLPYEVETWRPGAVSTVWVRMPQLPAESATVVWAYFGGGAAANDPTAVWRDGYSLVEHFAGDTASGRQRVDSTGTATGLVVGSDLTADVSDAGTGETRFEGSRLQYPGDIGGDYDRISISGLYSLTAADLAALSGSAPVIAKESATGDGQATFWQGVVKNESKLGTRIAGNSFEFDNVDINSRFELKTDGEPHLVTQTYDGMTYSVFVDGREVHSQMVEYRTTYPDPAVLTTIGDYYTNTGAISSPFHGVIDEVQIAGIAFTPDFEAFRYANYRGDIVAYGQRVSRTAESVALLVGTPVSGTDVEAGLVEVTGTVSERATLTATVAGEQVFSERIDAGVFSVRVPVDAAGEQSLELRATSVAEPADASAPVSVQLTVSDTTAPAQPAVSDTAGTAGPGASEVTLTATPQTESRERVETTFYADDLVSLDGSNVVVRSGSSSDRVPDALTPASGTVSGELLPTTVGSNANPYQIYEISLTPEQAAQDQFHLVWKGTADDRRVSAYVYDTEAGTWLLKDSEADAEGGAVALDVTARADEHAVSGGKLHLLVWRGLTEVPFGADHDYETQPDVADFDWGLDHVPDTQLYTQATPDMFVDQLRYIADQADERKTSLVIQSGDYVNREYLSQEYQWMNAERGITQLEAAKVPYMVSWGNHDYSDARNGRVMLPKYFPTSRLAESLEGSPWTLGEAQSIDNYYYTAEIGGAKLLVLAIGFWSADNAGDPGLAWARGVIAAHPDYSVIIASHNAVNQGTNGWANGNITSQLVDPFSNVKLVLGGHIAGTGVGMRTAADGARVYGILTDYQSRVYGGQEFMKFLSIDTENDLLYVNTYSPYLQRATSENGAWHQPVSESDIPGFHGADTENYVLEMDLGGTTTRTLAADSLTLAVGAPTTIGAAQTTIGAEPVSMDLLGARSGVPYEWYAQLSDGSGHTTRSAVSTFTLTAAEAPDAPQNVQATVDGDTVTVTWSAPASDGGAAVEQYQVLLSDGTVKTVDAGVLTAGFPGLAPGDYTATVRAKNAAGQSPASAPSASVRVVEEDPGENPGEDPGENPGEDPGENPGEDPGEDPGENPGEGPGENPGENPGEDPEENGTIVVTGSVTVGGEIVVHGSGFAAGTEFEVQLHSDPIVLGTVRSTDAGEFELRAAIPSSVTPGEHTVVVLREGAEVASFRLDVAAADDDASTPTPAPGEGLHGGIAATGVDAAAFIGWGTGAALLLLVGAALVLMRRRRRA
ncbi:DUF2341 domain-containing protein [Compostimonas suwonensis]|uniref:Uncharacterized protein DUF2341 n=1 Tax=Compostimonas suwonensis TaxID=1048394 RepID=A0A2M9C0C6_9MICO|nr:DUF2341 domain-containing protein [Compostimonas suwonensis]PJJ63785.1 uncharacterized protein DUF2341 [Compostimonas suwonensis]